MITPEIKQRNIDNLEYGSKEMKKLAKRLQACTDKTEEERNKLAATIVEASFFLNCFGAASAAFSKAFVDVQNNDLKGSPIYYLLQEFKLLHEEEVKKTMGANNDN